MNALRLSGAIRCHIFPKGAIVQKKLKTSVPSRVRNSRKMQNFWANFTDFEPEINIIKCKTEKLKQKT